MHGDDIVQVEEQPLVAINYGGNAITIKQNKGIPLEDANSIYNAYMKGFSGLKRYQDFCRKDVMKKGYILLSPITGHKAYIYDFEELNEAKDSFNQPGFWENYRELKKSNPNNPICLKVQHYFRRKSDSERQSINYRIQAAGSFCLRFTMIRFFDYLREHDLLFKVLISVIPYDEINCEAPEEIAENVASILHKCMVDAGKVFCTRCKLDADISRDKNNKLPTHWVH